MYDAYYQKMKQVADLSNMIIPRNNYLKRLIASKGNRMIKIITGIRRCGKSFLLFELFHHHLNESGVDDNHIIEIALDDRFLESPAFAMEICRNASRQMAVETMEAITLALDVINNYDKKNGYRTNLYTIFGRETTNLNILEGDVNFGRFFQSFYNTPLNTVLKIDTKAPSLTPTEPGDGIPETVAYTIDCKHNIFM